MPTQLLKPVAGQWVDTGRVEISTAHPCVDAPRGTWVGGVTATNAMREGQYPSVLKTRQAIRLADGRVLVASSDQDRCIRPIRQDEVFSAGRFAYSSLPCGGPWEAATQ